MGAFVSSPACPQQSAPLGLFLNTYLHEFLRVCLCNKASKVEAINL